MFKKILFSFLILITIGIITCTIYILVTPSVNVEKPKDVNKKNELVSETVHDEEIEMLFNLYLNEERHKFKWVYRLTEEDKNLINVEIYLDGHNIFKDIIADNLKFKNFSNLWQDEEIHSLLVREVNSFTIINSYNKDYLVFYITVIDESIKEIYYIMDASGNILNQEGLVKNNISKELSDYLYQDGNTLKIENNKIYYLKELEDKTIVEYEISIKNGKLEERTINTYNVGKEG